VTPQEAAAHALSFVAERVTATTGLPMPRTILTAGRQGPGLPSLAPVPFEELLRIRKATVAALDAAKADALEAEAALDDYFRHVEVAAYHRCKARALRTGDAQDWKRVYAAWERAEAATPAHERVCP
jgi:hypothetical protein